MVKLEQEKPLWALGLDIGGSHITAGLVNLRHRNIEEGSMIRRRVDSHAPAEEILEEWTDTIREMMNRFPGKFIRLCFAMPGPFDYAKGICLIKDFDKYESLYGMNIRAELARRLQIDEDCISFRNDAEAFLEGERLGGAAIGFDHAIGITLGTGLGSAVSHLGQTRDAGLSVVQYNGEKIEEFVSTRGLIRRYHKLSGVVMKDAKSIIDIIHEDDRARKAVEAFCDDLSWFLSYFIRKENPKVLVIGGNLAHALPLFEEQLLHNLASLEQLPVIKKAKLGEYAAMIGAACTAGENVPDQIHTL